MSLRPNPLSPFILFLLSAIALFLLHPQAIYAAPPAHPNLPVIGGISAPQIAGGESHTCALQTTGQVLCWGDNSFGQLGDGTNISRLSPTPVVGLTDVVEITAGVAHTCALTAQGDIFCWGNNPYGQLGTGDNQPSNTPQPVAFGNGSYRTVSAGGLHTCAIIFDSQLRCWGQNSFGQLGNNDLGSDSNVPVAVTLALTWVEVASGGFHSCAATTGGNVYCWGLGIYGQLGDNLAANSAVPVEVVGINKATSLALGTYHNCALLADGTLNCWGDNISGALGDGTAIQRNVPIEVPGLTNLKAITARGDHTCALQADGTLKCWGFNSDGQIGTGSPAGSLANPQTVSGLTNIVALAAGWAHTCVFDAQGRLYCWGNNESGQLGLGNTTSANTPVLTQYVRQIAVTAVSAGGNHTCGLLSTGRVRCWGANNFGQLGLGDETPRLTAETVQNLDDVIAIEAGSSHTCALQANGTMQCWGYNQFGQLGIDDDSTIDQMNLPIPVVAISNVVAIAAGTWHTCALLANGSAQCWGFNTFGQLGTGSFEWTDHPTAVSSPGAEITLLAAGAYHTCAVVFHSGAYCWGDNAVGQLGDGNDETTSNEPVMVDGLSEAIGITAGLAHSCVVHFNGSVLCWGANDFGQIGNNSTIGQLTPINANGIFNAVGISAGQEFTCAVLVNGDARCWGRGWEGQLGNGTIGTDNNSLVPVPVSNTNQQVVQLAAGNYHVCAVFADGYLRCWGDNGAGQLGTGPASFFTTPRWIDIVPRVFAPLIAR